MATHVLVPLFVGVAGHGLITLPTPRTTSHTHPTLDTAVVFGDGANCAWYTNNLDGVEGWKATNGSRVQIPVGRASSCGKNRNPWCAPGAASVLSPCGVQGGGMPCDGEPYRTSINHGNRITGAWSCGDRNYSLDGRDIGRSPNQGPANKWRQGGVAKVGWGIQANHGGGASWRLCPKEEPQSEECFQSNTLEFASTATVIRWVGCAEDKRCVRSGQEMVIPLKVVTENTEPAGSQWSENPIGHPCPDCVTCAAPRVDQGTYIVGDNCYKLSNHNFSMVDLVKVPSHLPPGEYTLSWRWDCVENPQIWSNCADIEIVAPNSPDYPEPLEWPLHVPGFENHVQFKCPEKNRGTGRSIPDSLWPDESSPYYPRDFFPEHLHKECASDRISTLSESPQHDSDAVAI